MFHPPSEPCSNCNVMVPLPNIESHKAVYNSINIRRSHSPQLSKSEKYKTRSQSSKYNGFPTKQSHTNGSFSKQSQSFESHDSSTKRSQSSKSNSSARKHLQSLESSGIFTNR